MKKDEDNLDNFKKLKSLKTRVVKTIKEAVNVQEIERLGISKLPLNQLSYYISGSENERTLSRNIKQFQEVLIYPKVLVDVSKIDLSTSILKENIAMPICIAPSAMHKMAHEKGELATSKAAFDLKTNITLSTLSSYSIEEVASINKNGSRWFQLYILKDRSFTLNFIKRVENSGYTGIVLTVDAPILGYRQRDFQVNFKFPHDMEPVNLKEVYNTETAKKLMAKYQNNKNLYKLEESMEKTGKSSEMFMFFDKVIEDSITWDIIEFLKKETKLKIILKGIHRADDALKAEILGVDAIMISNHGGRQVDTAPSSIEMLYAIKKALGKNSKLELYLDGGIRRGTDVFKALALGAKAVFIGRPVIWGLAAGGEEGVKRVLEFLKNEFYITMKLAGCKNVSEITEDHVRFTKNFAKF